MYAANYANYKRDYITYSFAIIAPLFGYKIKKNSMKKKEEKPKAKIPSKTNPLKEKLIAAVNKVLKDNKSELTEKIDKVVKKSIKRIVKKTDKQIEKTIKKNKI